MARKVTAEGHRWTEGGAMERRAYLSLPSNAVAGRKW